MNSCQHISTKFTGLTTTSNNELQQCQFFACTAFTYSNKRLDSEVLFIAYFLEATQYQVSYPLILYQQSVARLNCFAVLSSYMHACQCNCILDVQLDYRFIEIQSRMQITARFLQLLLLQVYFKFLHIDIINFFPLLMLSF